MLWPSYMHTHAVCRTYLVPTYAAEEYTMERGRSSVVTDKLALFYPTNGIVTAHVNTTHKALSFEKNAHSASTSKLAKCFRTTRSHLRTRRWVDTNHRSHCSLWPQGSLLGSSLSLGGLCSGQPDGPLWSHFISGPVPPPLLQHCLVS